MFRDDLTFYFGKKEDKITGGNKMSFQKVSVGAWKPEKSGDSVEGVLKSVAPGQYGRKIYELETQNGKVKVFGSVVLDDRMSVINIGDKIKIEFTGTQDTGKGNPAKIFEVYRWSGE